MLPAGLAALQIFACALIVAHEVTLASPVTRHDLSVALAAIHLTLSRLFVLIVGRGIYGFGIACLSGIFALTPAPDKVPSQTNNDAARKY